MKRRFLVALIALMIVGISAGAWALTRQEEDAPPAPLWYQQPPPEYPVLTDLGANADITAPRFASLSYGIQVFLWWDGTYRTIDLDNVRQLNFAYVKQTFSWRDIEPIRGEWHWNIADEVVDEVEYRGRRLIARISTPPDWAIQAPGNWEDPPYDMAALEEYCRALATRYRGRIEGYQIWNEPNLAREWGEFTPSPPGYVQLLATCGGAIREVDPDAIIISAGLAPTGSRDMNVMPDEEFLWRMYEAGLSPHYDVLGLHAPGYGLPPEASAEDARAVPQPVWARFRHVETMRAIMVHHGDAHKQIAILEMGYTTDTRPDSIYNWMSVTQEEQGDYLARAYLYAAENWRPWVGLMVTIYMSNPAWTPDNEEWWWAVNETIDPPIFTMLRPAYLAIANMEKISDNPAFAEPARDPNGSFYLEPLPERD